MTMIYGLARNPNNGLWYVMGYCGRSNSGRQQYMVVSDGYKTKAEAEARATHQLKADSAMRRELSV